MEIPEKFNRPLKLKEIPTNNRVVVIDNYSPNYNYIVEGHKIYSAPKGKDEWKDISDYPNGTGSIALQKSKDFSTNICKSQIFFVPLHTNE